MASLSLGTFLKQDMIFASFMISRINYGSTYMTIIFNKSLKEKDQFFRKGYYPIDFQDIF